MHSTDPNAHSAEALRRENDDLRRELELLRSPNGARASTSAEPGWKPSKTTIVALTLFSLILIVVAFFAVEYAYRRRRFPQQPYRNMLEFVQRLLASLPGLVGRAPR